MKASWPRVRLGKVLRQIERAEPVDANRIYRLFGVRWYGQGLFVREEKIGAEIAANRLYSVQPGDFVYNRLFAWKGSFAVAGAESSGAYVSNEFPCFATEATRLDPYFLLWVFRQERAWTEVLGLSTGATPTSRNRLNESVFLAMEIPLPPLAEQRRVVARIEELATQIHEARALRQQTAAEAEALVSARSAVLFRETSERGVVPLESIAFLERGKFSHRPRNDPRFFGGSHAWIQIREIESAEKIIRHWTETLNDEGLAISKKFTRGTVLISIAATIGSVGILDFDCCVPDSIVAITPRDGTDSEFVYHYLRYLRSHLEEIAPQSAQKNINLQILAQLPIPKLSASEQRRIVAELDGLQATVDELRRLQVETTAELDALLPAVLHQAFKGEL
jgi:type I restriction enzyme S subunit